MLNFNRNVFRPGTPKYDGNFNAIVEQARHEANIYKKYNVVNEFAHTISNRTPEKKTFLIIDSFIN